MAISNVISLVVQATDEATAPLKHVQAELQKTARVAEQSSQQITASTQSGLGQARTAVSSLSSALSATSTVLRLAGNDSAALAATLDKTSFALSAATIAVQSLRGATTAWALAMEKIPAILGAIRVGLTALLGPIGLVAAATVGVILALDALASKYRGHWLFKPSWVDPAIAAGERAQASLASVSLALTQLTERQLAAQGQSVETLTEKYKKFQERQKQLAEGVDQRRWAAILADTSRALSSLGDAAETAFARVLRVTANVQPALIAMALTLQRIGERDVTKAVIAGMEKVQEVVKKVVPEIDWVKLELELDPTLRRIGNRFATYLDPVQEDIVRLMQPAADGVRNVELEAEELAKELGLSIPEALQRIKDKEGGIDWIRVELEKVDPAVRRVAKALDGILHPWEEVSNWNATGVQKKLGVIADAGEQAANRTRLAWGRALGDLAVNFSTFGDFIQSTWRIIQNAIANAIADMVAKWLAAQNIMKSASSIFKSVLSFIPVIGPFLSGLIPSFQHGGIVTQPTVAMIGEAGPEAVIPLSQMAMAGGGGGELHVHFGPAMLDDISAWKFSQRIARELQRMERRHVPDPVRQFRGRSAAATVNGGGEGHTGFNRLRR